MKQFNLILNLVLVVAVGILYYLHFSDTSNTTDNALMPMAPVVPGGIYFVNSDSLLDNYQYYKTKKDDLEKRQNRIRAELKSAGAKLESDVQQYQENAAALSPAQRQQMEESLMMRQQQLIQQKDKMLSQLDDEQAMYSDSLFIRLTAFLREFNKGKGVNYVLGYQRGGGILFANDSLDITRPVLNGLNKAWSEE